MDSCDNAASQSSQEVAVLCRMLRLCLALGTALSLYPVGVGYAGRTGEEVKAILERAVAHIRDVGHQQAFADITRPDGNYVDGELYIFCYAPDGTTLAHGSNATLVGKNLSGMKDPDGKLVIVDLLHVGMEQGQGWIDFRWPNPLTKKIEAKSAYIIRADATTVCGSGYYKG
jgi:cytochrome c